MYMKLETERLSLRPARTEDFEAVYSYAGNRENARYMMFLPHESEEETLAFLKRAETEWEKESPAFYEFAVVLEEKQIGSISLYRCSDKAEGELGWILHKDFWGKGYIPEGAKAVMEFAKTQLGLQKLIAQCDARNKASAHVMEKIGMRLESCGTRTYEKTGEVAEELTYACVL